VRAAVHRFTITNPGDVSIIAAAIDAGIFDPANVVAAIGKTPGNGLVNDYTRGFLTLALSDLLASRSGRSRAEVLAQTPFIFSGGVEGVLTPHVSLFCREPEATSADATARTAARLAIGTALSRPLMPDVFGGEAEIALTAAAVSDALRDARIATPEQVHFVQVKAPCLTAEAIAAARRAGLAVRAATPSASMAYSRAAAAFGVARELQELPAERLTEAGLLADFSVFSRVASTSSGIEIKGLEVVALGMSAEWSGDLAIAHRPLADAIDIGAFSAVSADLGLSASPQLSPADGARVAAVLVKCEPSRDGLIRGEPHTMWNDGDIDAQRHIRGAVGAVAAAVFGDSRIFVSGGAEHQGPDGGGIVAVIAKAG
jgi:cyanuric acid amidohydrolase